MLNRCSWGACNTDSRCPERIRNIFYYITFPEYKQNRAKCAQVFNPNTNEDKNVHFLVVIHSLRYICSSTLMLSCASARYLWLKLANVKVRESMLMYCSRVLYSVGQKHITEVYISVSLHIKLVKCRLI